MKSLLSFRSLRFVLLALVSIGLSSCHELPGLLPHHGYHGGYHGGGYDGYSNYHNHGHGHYGGYRSYHGGHGGHCY